MRQEFLYNRKKRGVNKKIAKRCKKGVDKGEGAWYDSKAVSEGAQRPALDRHKNRNLLLTNFGECAKIKFRSQKRKRTLKIKQLKKFVVDKCLKM